MIPEKHQHGKKILDPRCLSLFLLESLQKSPQAGWPYRTPLADDQGGIKSARFPSDQLKVVLGIELPFIVAKEPNMAGDLFAFIKYIQPVNGKLVPWCLIPYTMQVRSSGSCLPSPLSIY